MPADAVFHQGHEGRFDGVIALYHDQGHIASKTLDFFGTVSATLGLPVIRTSVDHGTAFDLAGRLEADAPRPGRRAAGRRRARQPRPTNGISVAITVMKRTFASSGRLAM